MNEPTENAQQVGSPGDRFIMRKPLTHEQIVARAEKRATERYKPYWVFIWKDPKTGETGVVNFCMTEKKCVPLFERAHPKVKEYRAIGSDT